MRGALLALLLAAPAGAGTLKLRVVHTNDVHGWIMSRPDRASGRLVGGAAAFANVVKKERAASERFLLLDAGDWWQGTPEGSLSQGRAVAQVFDALGYDATVPGNHEYDAGESALSGLIASMKTPVVAANITVAATGAPSPYVKPFLIKDVGGVKVGVFGLLTTQMRRLAFAKNIEGIAFTPEVEAARKAVAALKAQGAEVVVMLSHVGQEYPEYKNNVGDDTVARDVPGIDLVVGGHAHRPLDPARRVGSTLIVNTGCYLDKAGLVTLDFDDAARKVVASTAALKALWLDEVGEEPTVKALVDKWRDEVGRSLDVVVATAAAPLTRDRARDSTMGNWMTDCLRRWTKTDLAFQNAGGIRVDFAAGPVRLRDLFNLMPFDNRVTTVYMRGSALRDLFEHSVGKAPGALQLSGGTVRFDPNAPVGARLKSVEVRGRPLKDDEVYSATAADFIVQGGDGYSGFSAGTERADHDTQIRDVLGWCAREQGTITPPALGRYATP